MNRSELLHIKSACSGRVRVSVVDAATGETVREEPWQDNLILNSGLDYLANRMAHEMLFYSVAGTANTPTKDLCDGFYYRTGTTVTRESGTRDFIVGDVGKLLRFGDGTEATITAFTSVTQVTVDTSGTVPTAVAKAITAASSTGGDFTITATAHGLAIGDRVTIAGMTPAGYNGIWTVATVPTLNSFTVVSAVNPGPGTVFGTVIESALPLIIYRVNQTGLTTETERSSNYPTFNWEDGFDSNRDFWAANVMTMRKTYDFVERASNINYTEIGFSPIATAGANLFSRILLAGPVTVLTGQLLRVKYELKMKTTGITTESIPTTDGGITGWPRPYNISSITSSGAAWTVTLAESHHLLAGGKININAALRPKAAITAASSNVTDFTITAAGHGRSPGDSIVIEGVTPSAYNGTFTVASVVGDNITVTSALNPGVGTVFGTVRQATPAPWYDGEHTIASVTSTTVVITSALSIAAAGASGTAYNNTKRVMKLMLHGWRKTISSTESGVTNSLAVHGGGIGTSGLGSAGCLEGNMSQPTVAGFGNTARGFIAFMEAVAVTTPPTVFPAMWTGTATLAFNGAAAQTGLSTRGATPTLTNTGSTTFAVENAYTNGTFYRETSLIYGAGAGNRQDIRMVTLYSYSIHQVLGNTQTIIGAHPFAYILFEEPQRKDSTHKLTLTLRRSWNRDLTLEAS